MPCHEIPGPSLARSSACTSWAAGKDSVSESKSGGNSSWTFLYIYRRSGGAIRFELVFEPAAACEAMRIVIVVLDAYRHHRRPTCHIYSHSCSFCCLPPPPTAPVAGSKQRGRGGGGPRRGATGRPHGRSVSHSRSCHGVTAMAKGLGPSWCSMPRHAASTKSSRGDDDGRTSWCDGDDMPRPWPGCRSERACRIACSFFCPLRPLGRIQTMITIIVMMRRIIVMMMHTMVPRRYDAMNLIRRQRCEAAPPAM